MFDLQSPKFKSNHIYDDNGNDDCENGDGGDNGDNGDGGDKGVVSLECSVYSY